jgi:hypothetical protein
MAISYQLECLVKNHGCHVTGIDNNFIFSCYCMDHDVGGLKLPCQTSRTLVQGPY